MSQTLLQEIKAVVDKRIDPLLKRRKELQIELEEIESEIGTAQQAISALEGKPAASASKAKVARKRNKSSASVEKVLEVMTAELKRGGGKLSTAALLASTKDKLKEAGFGLTGLKQRAEKLLTQENCFVSKGKSVSINAKAK